MKKTLKSALGVSVLIILIAVSCGKKDAVITPAPKPSDPTLSVTQPSKAMYKSTVAITYSATNADAVEINGKRYPVSGTLELSNLMDSTALYFTAIGKTGTTPAVKLVTVPVFSELETRLMQTIDPGKVIWKMISERAYFNNTWVVVNNPSCSNPVQLTPDNKVTVFSGMCTPGIPNGWAEWKYFPTEDSVLWAGRIYPDGRIEGQKWRVTFINDTTILKTTKNELGQIIEQTLKKRASW